MTALYLFSVILGGGFLALSVLGDLLGGGSDVELGGVDADLDVHLDGLDSDVGVDADVGQVDVHGDVAHHDLASHHGSPAAKAFSIRTLFYALFGFGAVGTLLTWWWDGASPVVTGVLAAATGMASGWLINATFGYVRRTDSGARAGEASFEGRTGRVTLPLAGSAGKVVVERAGREFELRALPHPSAAGRGDAALWKRVVVVDMERGVARVAPLDDEQLLNP